MGDLNVSKNDFLGRVSFKYTSDDKKSLEIKKVAKHPFIGRLYSWFGIKSSKISVVMLGKKPVYVNTNSFLFHLLESSGRQKVTNKTTAAFKKQIKDIDLKTLNADTIKSVFEKIQVISSEGSHQASDDLGTSPAQLEVPNKGNDETSEALPNLVEERTDANGFVFKGVFSEENGARIFKGTRTKTTITNQHTSEVEVFEGTWVNDQLEGNGSHKRTIKKYNVVTESLYVGNFKNGVYEGQGVFTDGMGTKRDGTWNNGKFVKGVVIFSLEDKPLWKYEGAFLDGAHHGQGKLEDFDDWTYEGEFEKGVRHGQGKCVYEDGTVEEGLWEDDVFVGKGKEPNLNDIDW